MPTKKLPPTVPHLSGLHRKGWSLRTAAPHLGVSFQHLNEVLRGRRQSRALLLRVAALPRISKSF